MTSSSAIECTRRAFIHTLLILPLSTLALPPATFASAVDESFYFKEAMPQLEQSLRDGRSVIWTLPNEATQYRPAKLTPVMLSALQAQREGRYLDALSQVDLVPPQNDEGAIDLLRASLYLQGGQPKQAESLLIPLQTHPVAASDAYALRAMAHLHQGELEAALADAEYAKSLSNGRLPSLALSYALQLSSRYV